MALADKLKASLYFILVAIMLLFLGLYSFTNLVLRADKFTMFLLSLIFVLLLLPSATYIKAFDIIEIRKELNALKNKVSLKK